MMKKGFGKSPNAVIIPLTVVSGLLVTANSYAEDIPASKTIPNHLSASPEETFLLLKILSEMEKQDKSSYSSMGNAKDKIASGVPIGPNGD